VNGERCEKEKEKAKDKNESVTYPFHDDVTKMDFKMIDFAHTYLINGEEVDDGYIWGLQNLINILRQIQNLP
jgi:hypothetical protein